MIEFLAILMVVVGVEGALLVLKYEVDHYEATTLKTFLFRNNLEITKEKRNGL